MKLKYLVFAAITFLFVCCFLHLLVIQYESSEFLKQEMEEQPQIRFGQNEANVFYFQKMYPKMRKFQPKQDDYPGIDGQGVDDDELEESERQRRFDLYKFNELASSKIPLLRSLPEKRPSKCFKQKYPITLPSASIIIVFHNEAWSALLRTVVTAVGRAPPSLIKEVLIVDDHSDLDVYTHLGQKLDSFAESFPKLKVIRAPKRIGLIKARLMGAEVATGEALVFLDSHCESFDGWLEPLLAGLKKYPRSAITPVIDVITFKTFKISSGVINNPSVGSFDWSMNFRWSNLDIPIPEDMLIPSPTMAGGLFAIRRDFFYESGSYDEEMEYWGSENLEMSFRLGMCFGGIYIHPCSIVAHVFRDASPHKMPSDAVVRNKVRLIEVWLDEYAEYMYKQNPSLKKHLNSTNISKRMKLRKSWNCSSFNSFVQKNINYFKPLPDLDPPASGHLKLKTTNICLDSLGKTFSIPGLYQCHGDGGNQAFVLTSTGELRNTHDECLDLPEHKINSQPKGMTCHGMKGNQLWNHTHSDGRIIHVLSQLCLQGDPVLKVVRMNICRNASSHENQLWEFSNYKK